MPKLQTPQRILRACKSRSVNGFVLFPAGFRPLPAGNSRIPLHLPYLFLLLSLLLAGCSGKVVRPFLYLSTPDSLPENIVTPRFLVKEPHHPYNRIGTPASRTTVNNSKTSNEIIVFPDRATLYYDTEPFATESGSYVNYIFRVHFEKVPFGFPLPNITAGKNPGILIIYTYSHQNELLLITTLHTCGCYLAFIPTDKLSKSVYPANWPEEYQWIYGHPLPTLLQLKNHGDRQHIIFTLESETHRISNITTTLSQNAPLQFMKIAPLSELYTIERLYEDGRREKSDVSFFELAGPRKGYVKNNTKLLERLLIGWWAFDWRVGEDKAYGAGDDSGVRLYTSLKFWDRKKSDIKNFPVFLKYWGWKL